MAMFEVNAVELRECLIADIKVGLVPMIASSPGMGKSDIVRDIAKNFKLKMIDVRVALHEPVDFNGYPDPDEHRMHFKPAAFLPLEGIDTPPEGHEGWMLFLDEFNSGNKQTEAACYKLILDREVGSHKLHPRCMIICAGNLTTDRAIVNTQSTATTSRLTHYRMRIDHDVWVDWANANDIDHRIISLIKFTPGELHRFDPASDELTFQCPRTWAFASKILKGKETINRITKVRLAGAISAGAAVTLTTFIKIYQDLPTIEQILADPKKGWKVPTEPDRQYAITTMLSHNVTVGNIDKMVTAIERLPMDFQVITFKDIYKRTPELKKNSAITDWILRNSSVMF